MNKRARNLLIILFAIIAWTISSYQFNHHKQKHERLVNKGEIVNAVSNYSEHLWVGYAGFSFITKQGVKVDGSRKCGNRKSFNKQYANLKIIYNPDNPKEYENLLDFEGYSLGGLNILFYGLYPAAMTFVCYSIVRFIFLVIKKLK